jgi:hypothetical protein
MPTGFHHVLLVLMVSSLNPNGTAVVPSVERLPFTERLTDMQDAVNQGPVLTETASTQLCSEGPMLMEAVPPVRPSLLQLVNVPEKILSPTRAAAASTRPMA